MSLAVLTYNIRKSKGYRGFTPVPEQLGGYIASQQCDVVLCQEVAERPSKNISHCDKIAHELKMGHSYGANVHYPQGSHGNATFSALPLVSSQNIDLSVSMFEFRGALHSIVELCETKRCHFFNVHLGLTPWQRRKQVALILNYINEHVPSNDAVVIAGDFNDFSGALRKHFETVPDFKCASSSLQSSANTWPSKNPRFQLDHIFYRHLKLVTVDVLKQIQNLSDHLACRAEFEI